jgi:hypothetical protein
LPLTQLWSSPQQATLPQHFSVLLQAIVPQQVLPAEAQKGLELLVQHSWPCPQDELPQHLLPCVMQKGRVPVVQQVWVLLQFWLPQLSLSWFGELAVACPSARLIPSEPSTPPATMLASSRRVCRRDEGPASVRATSSRR